MFVQHRMYLVQQEITMDHDRWEAYCLHRCIKSTIGNYRDNRFNAIFQTSAEIILHREDFLEVLSSVKQPNLNLKSVEADLRCDTLCSMMKVFGLIYLKITGPYWNLMTSGCVAYLELYLYIQTLRSFLEACVTQPSLLLKVDSHWLNEELLNDVPHLDRFLNRLATEEQEYEKDALSRTEFAHLTNLGCEHHFGDLTVARNVVPMHHHSCVQLLKRNRNSLMQWLEDMPKDKKSDLLKSAGKVSGL